MKPEIELEAVKAERDALRARIEAAEKQEPASKDLIRDVFLRNGFTIKEGCDDLKDYVFNAAFELLSVAMPPMPAQQEENRLQWIDRLIREPNAENDGEKIIAFGRGWVFECGFENGRWCSYAGEHFTHWMPGIPYPNSTERIEEYEYTEPHWWDEAKRAFWAGLEIGAAFGGCAILPKWEEYIAKREIELTQSTDSESGN